MGKQLLTEGVQLSVLDRTARAWNFEAVTMILIVEDDSNIRASLLSLLELEGFAAKGAANGREALDLLQSGMKPELLLLDLMMPVMSGWEFLEARARDATLSGIPVIAMSALADSQSRLPIGCVEAFCRKPIDLDVLLDEMKRHLTSVA